MAEGLLRSRWAKDVGHGLTVSSMGIHGMDHQPPTEPAIKVCADNDVDISKIRSRPLVPDELKRADLIFVMEPVQKDFLCLFHPYLDDMIFLLGAWPDKAESKKTRIKDPVGGTFKEYQKTFKTLSEHVDRIIPLLRSEYGY